MLFSSDVDKEKPVLHLCLQYFEACFSVSIMEYYIATATKML